MAIALLDFKKKTKYKNKQTNKTKSQLSRGKY